MKSIAAVLVALILVLGFHAVSRADAPAGVQKWEYKVIISVRSSVTPEQRSFFQSQGMEAVDATAFMRGLSSAGTDGWDLVNVVKWDEYGWLYYFKRPAR